MQWSAKFRTDGSLLTITATGDVGSEGFPGIEELMSHPAWHPGIPVLCDFRGLNIGKLTAQDVEHLVEMYREYPKRAKGIPSPIAVVVANELDYGLSRMWALYANKTYPIHDVFYGVEDAMKWLRACAKEQTEGLE
jgi:hypothetical protein